MLSSSSSAAMGMAGWQHQHQHQQQQQQQQQRGAAVFTAAQWAELEQQALIYKYLMAGVPVPADLLPARSHSAAAAGGNYSFANPAVAPFYHHHPSLSYYAYYGKKMDPEPWRCRRTDGKKWRCSKEAHPDSKYCERHMHRGRNRSRKPVESKTAAPAAQSQPQLSTVTTASHDAAAPLQPLAAGDKAHGLSLGGAGSSQLHVDTSSYSNKYSLGAKADVGELSFFSGTSGNSRGFTIDSPTDNSWHSLPSSISPYSMSKPRDCGLLPGSYSYSHLEPSQELGQVTIASLSQEQERRRSFSGGAGGMLRNVKHENQPNQPLRPFFDEWPGTRDSWSEMDEERSNRTSFSTTQLSISIPMPRCGSPIGD